MSISLDCARPRRGRGRRERHKGAALRRQPVAAPRRLRRETLRGRCDAPAPGAQGRGGAALRHGARRVARRDGL